MSSEHCPPHANPAVIAETAVRQHAACLGCICNRNGRPVLRCSSERIEAASLIWLHSLHVPVTCQSATSPNATGWPVYLPVFAPPSFLSSCRSCNLWLNGPSPVTSTFHFDSYNNFLCMYDSEFEIALPVNKSVTFTSRLQIHRQQNRTPAPTFLAPQLPPLVALAKRRNNQHEIASDAI